MNDAYAHAMQVQNASLTLGVLHLEPQMMKKSDK
jgi:hypothetical protein